MAVDDIIGNGEPKAGTPVFVGMERKERGYAVV